tara:strand:- start:468 stop:596 length:129 start_codon:yes stop_codon:yes gene_type:complete
MRPETEAAAFWPPAMGLSKYLKLRGVPVAKDYDFPAQAPGFF